MLGGILSGRIEALQAKKDILDTRIQQEHARPQPDTIRLQSLKRMRLRLEDDLVRIRRRAARMMRPRVRSRVQLAAAH